ncbi:MAG: glycoside hydrolase family 130 protein [Sphingomonas sp.]
MTKGKTRDELVGPDLMTHSDIFLRPDPARTVIRPFSPEDPPAFAVKDHPRAQRIADRVLAMDADWLGDVQSLLLGTMEARHRGVDGLFLRRAEEVSELTGRGPLSREQRLLMGAYFSEEYSFEAAALFNPSIVPHPDQEEVPEGCLRFILSLRGIGEGHVSSITFRTGIWHADGRIAVDPASPEGVPPRIEQGNENDDIVHLICADSREISETVIFPILPSQRQGVEDMRMVRFVEDDGSVHYYGTYTAFSGAEVRSELLHAKDFRRFEMHRLRGDATSNKGMALFPRRIDGRYMMLGRQDNESIWLLSSDDLHVWNGGQKIVSPKAPWEFAQMGNCGSPIEIDEGWLVMVHGVGMMRAYCMGAVLLDKADPSKLLARTRMPLITPSPKVRGGYVPNVVYSCGSLLRGRELLVPYGVADQFTAFATVSVDAVLGAME